MLAVPLHARRFNTIFLLEKLFHFARNLCNLCNWNALYYGVKIHKAFLISRLSYMARLKFMPPLAKLDLSEILIDVLYATSLGNFP